MKKTVLLLALFAFFSVQMLAQNTITGTVKGAQDGLPLPGVNVSAKGFANTGTVTNMDGIYTIQVPAGANTLVFVFVGMQTKEIAIDGRSQIDVSLETEDLTVGEVVVTALGMKEQKKNLGITVTEVKGEEVSQSQRTNFMDALQGRVAGLVVNNSSGLPGSSSTVVIRGASSLSGSNEPLYVVDGLPYSNKTFSSAAFGSTSYSSSSYENRSIDFTNRASDINPADIETITVLKGPEATSLYGVEAANGAIIITTKRGKAGQFTLNYNNSISFTKITKYPEIQQVYGQGSNGVTDNTVLSYWGEPYAADSVLYDNITPFFKTGILQKHNLAASGGNERLQYRVSAGFVQSDGIVEGSGQKKFTLSNTIRGEVNKFIDFDVTMTYTNDYVDGVYKGANGPMLGLLRWPSGDDASNYLNPDGTRRKITTSSTEFDNPYFNVNKNDYWQKTSRLSSTNLINISPLPWLKFIGKFGFDVYSNQNWALRHPESYSGVSTGGMIDDASANNRDLNFEYYVKINKEFNGFKVDFQAGSTVYDRYYKNVATYGTGFMDPYFESGNNVPPDKMRTKITESQKRLVGVLGILSLNYKGLVNLQMSARNDWVSTLPIEDNDFFYPSVNGAFILSELPFLKDQKWLSFSKLRAAYGVARKDPPPYSVFTALEGQLTTGGGYAYGFTGPNPLLTAEKMTSYEFGGEVRVLNNRLGIDVSYYDKQSEDQIVSDYRLSYGTGFILSVINGGSLWNKGFEVQFDATPFENENFVWQISLNYNKQWSKLTYLPAGQIEYYNSATWIYGNVRNGAVVGESITTLTGLPYERNVNGDILINPSTGLPLRKTTFGAIGDRNPDFMIGISNQFSYKGFTLSFLFDIRKGGDVFNATEHFLTVNGLSKSTLNREEPVIVKGVMKDGYENTANPTYNNVVIYPARSSSFYYTTPNNGLMNEEDFVEKDINWLRLKDVTISYTLPQAFLESKLRVIKSLSFFFTATDLFIITNYRGLDPVIIGNNAAVQGTGSAGIDYGNFPLPVVYNFGLNISF